MTRARLAIAAAVVGAVAVVAVGASRRPARGPEGARPVEAGAPLELAVARVEAAPARGAGVTIDPSPLDRAAIVSVDCAAGRTASVVVTSDDGAVLAPPAPLERVPPTSLRLQRVVRARDLPPHLGGARAQVVCGARAGAAALFASEDAGGLFDPEACDALVRGGEPARALATVDRARGALTGSEGARADATAAEAAIALGRNALAAAIAARALADPTLPAALRARLLRALVLARAESDEATKAPAERASLTSMETDDLARALDAALDLRVALAHDRSYDPPEAPKAARTLMDRAGALDDASRGPIAAMLCAAGVALSASSRPAGDAAMRDGARAAERAGSVADRAYCTFAAGDAARFAGRLDEAERLYVGALEILGNHPLPREQREAWFSAAMLSDRRGRHAEALARAVTAYQWVDASLALEPDLAAREALLVDTNGYYGAAVRFAILAGDPRAAVAAAEWGKGRAFGALLHDDAAIASSSDFALVAERSGVEPAPADRIDALARSLRPGDAALSYWILERNQAGRFEAAIGVVTRNRTTAHLVELPDGTGADARALAAAVEAGDGARAKSLGRKLYAALLAPIESDLAGIHRLFVSPQIVLHALPWPALHDGERFAAERFSFARVPPLGMALRESADDAPLFAPASPRAWMIAIDPARASESPLPGLHPLAAELAARVHPRVSLSGAALTAEAFVEGIGRSDAVFYGGHARFDPKAPLASALLVAPSPSGADRVEARAVLGLEHRIDLVMLLGCETSRLWEGKSSYGDEAIGLQRAFLAGGARHVLGALWPVLDRDAEDFVRALLAQDAGLDVVSAVGAAERCLASGQCPSRGVSAWASFVVDTR